MNRLCVAMLIVVLWAGDRAPAATDDKASVPAVSRDENSISAKFARIKAEYDAELNHFWQRTEKVEDLEEYRSLFEKLYPNDESYSRRMIDLALTAPGDLGSRDALLWVIDHPGRIEEGPFGDEYGRAAGMLVRHHGDDPEAVRIGLRLDNAVSFQRDILLYGFLAAAKSRESKGLARLSLANYLEKKGKFADMTRSLKGRRKYKVPGPKGPDGKPTEREVETSIEDHTRILALRESDPEALRKLAESFYEEVIAEYSDVPYITTGTRNLEAVLKQPTPTWNGKPMSAAEIKKFEAIIARKKTLGEIAEGRLDEMHNLAVGKPAPEIDGVGFDGKSLKLSDYRGKVVALVFWGTWCGPCMAEVPRERDLVERLKGQPFVMLGINCDEEKEAAVKVMTSERITWPNWHDGAPDTGPITKLYHIRAYPTVMIIDGAGIIRHKGLRGEAIDQAVDALLAEAKGKDVPKP